MRSQEKRFNELIHKYSDLPIVIASPGLGFFL
jgi:hypothetical protein